MKPPPIVSFLASIPHVFWFAAIIAISIWITMAATSPKAGHELCGDYVIGRRDGFVVRIWNKKTQEIVVSGDVRSFAVNPPYVVGFTLTDCLDPLNRCTAGYFLLNTATGERQQGLPMLNRQHPIDVSTGSIGDWKPKYQSVD